MSSRSIAMSRKLLQRFSLLPDITLIQQCEYNVFDPVNSPHFVEIVSISDTVDSALIRPAWRHFKFETLIINFWSVRTAFVQRFQAFKPFWVILPSELAPLIVNIEPLVVRQVGCRVSIGACRQPTLQTVQNSVIAPNDASNQLITHFNKLNLQIR